MNVIQLILLALVAAIAGMGSVLDERQTHRPLVACTLVGLVLGDLKTGIILGGSLEMIALGWMNVGAAMAPDAALASVISAILVIVGKQSIAEGIAVAVPIAAAGQVLTIFVRTITVFFQHKADDFAEQANFKGIEMCHLAGIALQALRVAIPAVLVGMIAGTSAVEGALNAIPEVITRGLQIAGGFIVVVGYAMVINMMEAKALMPFFFLGFVIAAFTEFNLVGLGILGLCLAILYIQLNPIDVVTFLFATTEFHFRQIIDVFDLCQEEQTTHHGVYIERLTHIDITKARAEGRITCRGGILEIQISTAVDDDVTTCTGVYRQVTLISEICQTSLGDIRRYVCLGDTRSVIVYVFVSTTMSKTEDNTSMLIHHHRIYSTIV